MDKQKEFEQRVNCGIAYCEDTPSKQKEIEAMAKFLGEINATSAICNGLECEHCKYNELDLSQDYTCIDFKVAELLQEQGYRKIDKDSVVLSREEYNEIKIYQSYIPEMKKAFDKVSKATAEKILEPLYNACKEDTYGQVVVDFAILENFARQFGVEIKE